MASQGTTVLHVETPLLESKVLAQKWGRGHVFLKMDSFQPSGSFKIRGIGKKCASIAQNGCKRFICASGGNAGLAVAYSGRKLGVPVTVCVPESCSEFMRTKIRDEGAEVVVHGAAFDDANKYALELQKSQPDSEYIHPFDDPLLWDGHETMIEEVHKQFRANPHNLSADVKPDVIITVVGGGGLLVGICQGLQKVGWADVPIVACETVGARSFADSVKQGQIITLPKIESIATTLGAKTVCKEVFEWSKKHPIHTFLMSDADAVNACISFADDERVLVEPACGAGLASLYMRADVLQKVLQDKPDPVILVIVCGGNAVSIKKLLDWQAQFAEPCRKGDVSSENQTQQVAST